MSAMSGRCPKCDHPYARHLMDLQHRTMKCPPAVDAPVPLIPAGFKSKAICFDLFKKCRKCHVKKYINRESNLCLACNGMP